MSASELGGSVELAVRILDESRPRTVTLGDGKIVNDEVSLRESGTPAEKRGETESAGEKATAEAVVHDPFSEFGTRSDSLIGRSRAPPVVTMRPLAIDDL